jgi:predicted acyltransferase
VATAARDRVSARPVLRRGRIAFLDAARALAVLSMLAANLVNVFAARRPHWLGHNTGNELLPFDLPAPVFQLLIGVSLTLFLVRRQSFANARRARWLAARRFGLLIMLGMVLDAGTAGALELRWGVLQTLGTGGLLATALVTSPDWVLLAVAGAITATHYGPGNSAVHGAAADCLPFLSLTLAGVVVGRPLASGATEIFRRRALAGAVTGLAGAVVLRAAGIPFNKVIGSSSFVLLAAGVSCALLAALASIETSGVAFPEPLVTLGANALTAWVLQYLLVFYPVGWTVGTLPELPEAVGLGLVGTTTIVLAAVTVGLARRGVRIPI